MSVTIRSLDATGATVSDTTEGNHLSVDFYGDLHVYQCSKKSKTEMYQVRAGKWQAAFVDHPSIIESTDFAKSTWTLSVDADFWTTDDDRNLLVTRDKYVVAVMAPSVWNFVRRNGGEGVENG